MDSAEVVWVVLGLLVVFAALWLITSCIIGAVWLFGWAAESGFIGVAVYVACWVFLTPVMVIGCLAVGMVAQIRR